MHVCYETGLSGFRVSHVTYISGWIAQEVSGTYAGRSRARQPVNCFAPHAPTWVVSRAGYRRLTPAVALRLKSKINTVHKNMYPALNRIQTKEN